MSGGAFECINPDDVHVVRINDNVRHMEDYTGHEHVFRISNDAHGVVLFIGVHDTTLGPSIGGLRFAPYESEEKAIKDVLRLSRGMTYKNSVAALDNGGGKAVGIAPAGGKRPSGAFLETVAVALNRINGEHRTKHGDHQGIYFTAEDAGVKVADIKKVAEHSPWVTGAKGEAPDPSPQTARGIVAAIRTSARAFYGSEDLASRTISIQGAGNVGMELIRLLFEQEGVAGLNVTDIDAAAVHKAKALYGAKVFDADKIFDAPADIFSPNAMGGVLTKGHIDRLHAAGVRVIAGGANNQEPDEKNHTESKYLQSKGMLYAPDFVANLGGVVWVAREGEVVSDPAAGPAIKNGIVRAVVLGLENVFELAKKDKIDTATAAVRVAIARIEQAAAQKGGNSKTANG
jgi:leucine dehydrogenase